MKTEYPTSIAAWNGEVAYVALQLEDDSELLLPFPESEMRGINTDVGTPVLVQVVEEEGDTIYRLQPRRRSDDEEAALVAASWNAFEAGEAQTVRVRAGSHIREAERTVSVYQQFGVWLVSPQLRRDDEEEAEYFVVTHGPTGFMLPACSHWKLDLACWAAEVCHVYFPDYDHGDRVQKKQLGAWYRRIDWEALYWLDRRPNEVEPPMSREDALRELEGDDEL